VNHAMTPHISRIDPKGRIIIATPGLVGHDRSAEGVARALRDAGYEVIYTGPGQTAAEMVAAVITEDFSILVLSILSGTHMAIVARVIEMLAQGGASDTGVLVGGTIPQEDAFALEILGARAVFTPRTTTDEIVEAVDHLNAVYGSVVRAS
jgi:methylmalonyl-CoA mutase C-terminal domain/subunit